MKRHTSLVIFISLPNRNQHFKDKLLSIEQFLREENRLSQLLKEFQLIMSLKIWRSMAYTVCHAAIPMTS